MKPAKQVQFLFGPYSRYSLSLLTNGLWEVRDADAPDLDRKPGLIRSEQEVEDAVQGLEGAEQVTQKAHGWMEQYK